MQQEHIIKYFFEKDQLLTPKALDIISKNENLINKTFTKFIIDDVNEIKIIKNIDTKLKEIKTQDFIEFYKSKYEKMKNIITGRIKKDFVSINNIQNDSYIIGIIKDIKNNEIEVEDLTSSIKLEVENLNGLELDDVVAIRAVNNKCKEIIYPDIQIRQPIFSFGKVCFVSEPEEKFFEWCEKQDIENLIILCTEKINLQKSCKNKNVFVTYINDYPQFPIETEDAVPLSNPSMIEINGVKILIISNFDLSMVKKRYLGKSKEIFKEDFLVLDQIPDIVHTNTGKNTNYKSMTILNTKEKPVIIDLSNREISFVEL